jgi:hypothetical protein
MSVLYIFSLLISLFYEPLGVVVMMYNGYYHYTSNINEFYDTSSDWIIMRELFGQSGFSAKIHQFMAFASVLLAASIGYSYLKKEKSKINMYATVFLIVLAVAAEMLKPQSVVKN